MGPAILSEDAGAIQSVHSGEESGACGEEGGTATAPEDAATSWACSNVARLRRAAVGEAADAVVIVEEAIGELDAGRIEDARALLKAFVAATRAPHRA